MDNTPPKTRMPLYLGFATALVTFLIATLAGYNAQSDDTVTLGIPGWLEMDPISPDKFRAILSLGLGFAVNFGAKFVIGWVSKRSPILADLLQSLFDGWRKDTTPLPEQSGTLLASDDYTSADTLYQLARGFAARGDRERAQEMSDAAKSLLTEIAEEHEPEADEDEDEPPAVTQPPQTRPVVVTKAKTKRGK